MLRLNNITAQPGSVTTRKRLGRGPGSGLGKTAGKGHKGQLARTGGTSRPGFEGGQTPLYRRIPKRGFTNVHARSVAEVNLSALDKLEATVKEVNLDTLKAARIIKGNFDRLAILGTGEIKRALTFKAHRVSASAQEKIQKAGGSFELIAIPGPQPREIKKKSKSKK